MKKRGQVTVFVIIGIVIVIVAALVLYSRTNVFLINPTSEDLNSKLDDINSHVLKCLAEASEPPIKQIGLQGGYLSTSQDTFRLYNDTSVSYLCYSIPNSPLCMNRMLRRSDMERQLSSAVDISLEKCLDVQSFKKFGSFDILTPKHWVVDTKIGSDMVVVNLKYPIRLKSSKSSVEVSVDDFTKSFNYPLGYLYEVSQEILDYETEFGEFDQMIYMLAKKGQVRIDKKRPYPDKLYILSRYNDGYVFQFMVQGEPTILT